MKKICIFLLLLSVTNYLSVNAMENKNEFTEFIRVINQVKTTKLRIKTHASTDLLYVSKEGVDEYVRCFDKVRFPQDTATVQCLYYSDDLGGHPKLYYCKDDVHELHRDKKTTHVWRSEHAAYKFVEPADESLMAYFQYLIFKVYGEQFALYWHALYRMHDIILEHPFIRKNQDVIEMIGGRTVVNEELNNQVLKHGLYPEVIMTTDSEGQPVCKVTLYESNHQAYSQVIYQIECKKPWNIQLISTTPFIQKPEILY